MGQHDAPVNWLERWRQTEPLRLYLYGITVPVLGLALVYGWVTTDQAGAWLGVAAALFLGSTVAGELARRQVTSPATRERELVRVDEAGYARGVQDAVQVSPDDLAEARTAQLLAVRPQKRCRNIEHGRRCVLNPHEEGTPHHYG